MSAHQVYVQILCLVLLALPVATISVTISKGLIFEKLRGWCKQTWSLLGELIACPYCTSHWVALVAVILCDKCRPNFSSFWLVNIGFAFCGVVAVATPLIWIVYRSYRQLEPLIPPSEEENRKLREIIEQARKKLIEQAEELKRLKDREPVS